MVAQNENGDEQGGDARARKADQPDIDAAAVSAALEAVINSDAFARADRARALLTYIVETEQRGDAGLLKGFTIAQDVFGKDDDFDPAMDAVVRVQAGRLRDHLSSYYAGEGADDPVEISVPKGSYVPAYRRRVAEPPAAPATGPAGRDAGPIRDVDFGASSTRFELDKDADHASNAVARSLNDKSSDGPSDPFLSPFLVRNIRRFWLALTIILILLTVILLLVWQS